MPTFEGKIINNRAILIVHVSLLDKQQSKTLAFHAILIQVLNAH